MAAARGGRVVGPAAHALGSRLPFIIAATPALILALAMLGFVTSIAAAAVVLALFFAAYFVAYEPYRALYPDLVDDEIVGRAQSSQAIFRGLGTFLALVGGGLLISISEPLPFLATGVVVAASMGAFCVAGVRHRRRERPRYEDAVVEAYRRTFDLVRGRRRLQAFLAANTLWELALSAQDLRGALCHQDLGSRWPARRWSSAPPPSSSWAARSSAATSATASGARA